MRTTGAVACAEQRGRQDRRNGDATPEQAALGDDPVPAAIDPPVGGRSSGPCLKRRPGRGRRLAAELRPVEFQRIAILAVKLLALPCAATGWHMMDLPPEDDPAEHHPIGTRVEKRDTGTAAEAAVAQASVRLLRSWQPETGMVLYRPKTITTPPAANIRLMAGHRAYRRGAIIRVGAVAILVLALPARGSQTQHCCGCLRTGNARRRAGTSRPRHLLKPRPRRAICQAPGRDPTDLALLVYSARSWEELTSRDELLAAEPGSTFTATTIADPLLRRDPGLEPARNEERESDHAGAVCIFIDGQRPLEGSTSAG